MKKQFILICLALSLFILNCNKTDGSNKKAQSSNSQIEDFIITMGGLEPFTKKAIDFSLTDLEGKKVKLSDYKGKVVFLNFWVTWCPNCRAEMPAMEKLYQTLKEKDFIMLAVNFDQPSGDSSSSLDDLQDSISTYAMMLDMTFPVLLDPNKQITSQYEVKATPTTYIIDKNGNMIGKFIGERHWDSKESIEFFSKLCDNPAS